MAPSSSPIEPNPNAHPSNIITAPGQNYRFTLLTPQLLRFEWSPSGAFEDRASTFALHRGAFAPVAHRIKDNAPGAPGGTGQGGFEILTEFMHVDYDGKEFSPSGLVVDVKGRTTLWGTQWRYGSEEKVGAGRKGNLGGTARTLDEVDGRCDVDVGVCSRLGFAVIDDSGTMLFDPASDWVAGRPGREAGYVDGYLFAYGRDYRAAVRDFYRLSGPQPVVPRWALGNWWSRYYRYSDTEYLALMDAFAARNIPLSVAVIDMDWHYTYDERVPHAGWTGYTWDHSIFPDPAGFGKEIHKRKLKMSLNDHPHSGVHHHEESYEAMAKVLGHDTSEKNPILFDPTSKKFMDAFNGVLHRELERKGCDFWWIDWQQGRFSRVPGIDPLWVLNHFCFEDNRNVASASDSASKEGQQQQPMIFSRYGGPGSHRYPVGFSGDTVTTWASLQFQPEFTATASNIGYGWWSHDIGGHMFGVRDDELVTRWVQLGVLSPIMRLHSTNSRWMGKEPWRYRPESEKAVEAWMRWRHRLLPYLYSLDVRAARPGGEGMPLVQPLYWHFAELDEAYAVPNEYFFGSELLVAPIVTPRDGRTGLASVKAWLPPRMGRFVDIFTGVIYDGDRELTLYRGLGEVPVLAHEGSVVPLDGERVPGNGAENPQRFEVLVVVGRDGEFELVEDQGDDGEGLKKEAEEKRGEEGAVERKSFVSWKQQDGKLTANVAGRTWSFRFLGVTEVPSGLKILVDGKDVTSDANVAVQAYPEAPGLLIECSPGLGFAKYDIAVEFGVADPQLSVRDHRQKVEEMLLSYQVEFALKDKIWKIVEGKTPGNVKVGQVLALGLDEVLAGPVVELLVSDIRGWGA
ncbi:uncharacterized protein HMPREF1541_05338 [Cyphellophora europaea CBS 101466]|uniref:Alpha-glucosidase N-terminal domain-containing protein n=1 Tax=Cyphellophora europaea (strain CBS 101466) TaxID=1220924 RepID=W2RRG6_CYPE1|nr:uncharacterized protein HMPREF1541_05338 [Cyphellophora europaea CBS 101466]ETN39116.1 hypothetical protein HMPREF1541_05338 [Cyphellophora europaea CBS 101466]